MALKVKTQKVAVKSAKQVKAKMAEATKKVAEPRSAIWYRTNPAVAAAFLYNCRKADLVPGNGIKAGTLVVGTQGIVKAEKDVPGVDAAKTVTFKPNCVIQQDGTQFDGMVLGNPAQGRYGVIQVKTKGKAFLKNIEFGRSLGHERDGNHAKVVSYK